MIYRICLDSRGDPKFVTVSSVKSLYHGKLVSWQNLGTFGVSPMVPLVILPLVPLATISCHWYLWQSENSERILAAIDNFFADSKQRKRSSFAITTTDGCTSSYSQCFCNVSYLYRSFNSEIQ